MDEEQEYRRRMAEQAAKEAVERCFRPHEKQLIKELRELHRRSFEVSREEAQPGADNPQFKGGGGG